MTLASGHATLDDLALIGAVVAGDDGAWAAFVERVGPVLLAACHGVFGDADAPVEYAAVLEHLRSDRVAALRAYDGRSTLSTYLIVKLRPHFDGRVLALLGQEPSRGWSAFERLYRRDLERVIRRTVPAWGDLRDDAYQDIATLLTEHACAVLRKYDGRGSFGGYVREVVGNLCRDLQRKHEGRRRLPAAVRQLPALEQQVYKALVWSGYRAHELTDHLRAADGRPYPPEVVRAALERVQSTIAELPPTGRPAVVPLTRSGDDGEVIERPIADAAPTPLDLLVSDDAAHERLKARLEAVLPTLSAEEQLFIKLRFFDDPPRPPRDIARVMGREPREIYRLWERLLGRLRTALGRDPENPGPVRPDRQGKPA